MVFAESWWIGTAEENPEEKQLPMPPELQMEKLHDEAEVLPPGAAGTGRTLDPKPRALPRPAVARRGLCRLWEAAPKL